MPFLTDRAGAGLVYLHVYVCVSLPARPNFSALPVQVVLLTFTSCSSFRSFWEVLMRTQHFWSLSCLKNFFYSRGHAYICACLCVCDCGYVIVCVSILLFCTIIQPTQIIMTSMDAVCSCVCFLAIISRGTFFFPLNFKVTARYEEFILVVKTENFQFLFQQTC